MEVVAPYREGRDRQSAPCSGSAPGKGPPPPPPPGGGPPGAAGRPPPPPGAPPAGGGGGGPGAGTAGGGGGKGGGGGGRREISVAARVVRWVVVGRRSRSVTRLSPEAKEVGPTPWGLLVSDA